ncbi:potassium channel SKOR-like isoform X2 [Salvia miltiorrhiza]|uniref:potassium channel SKOR-like isoform X2 n=1 Tax=Salvia miltiorrhiza TaxID=226208 RepID=UPI0025AC2E00|nr:potassium channel SKOR-like isoform X2 [Salvia miltiorrhiza]
MERNRNRGREENEKESEGDEQRYSVDLLRNYSTQVSFSFRHSQSQSHEFIIRPDNRWYVAWSNFILIWAIYSSFFTPLEFGFFRGLPENLFLLDVAGQFTFSVDIFVSFFVAYTDAHSYCLVYDRRLIAARYLKSRFLIDLLGCLPWDLIYRRCGEKELVRYMLWIRLSRAVRVTDFFEKMEKDTRVNYLFTRIVKLFVVELYCTHTAACIFYYLATTLPASEEAHTWIGSLQLGDYSYTNFRHIDLWTRYITALYFAVVTMATVGYGEIHAVNTREMIFVMLYVSLDMILGAYLLGNMTALIVKGSKTERFRDKMAELIKYSSRNKLGKSIGKEMKGHVRLQYESSYADASALRDLPLALRAKISNKLYEPNIRQVPLFKDCSDGFIKKIAIKVHEEFFLPGEVIVEEGTVGDQLYILCDGKLEQVRNREDGEAEGSVPVQYSSIGDISVVCSIPEARTVRASELSRLLRVDKQALIQVIQIHFADGRIIIDNLLRGREHHLRKKILESDMVAQIEKCESEVAMRLNCAANDGDLHRLRRLVEAGADPNKVDYHGQSPLHRAAAMGYEDIVQFLIQIHADINLRDNFGKTPLFEAIKKGHGGAASLLEEAGAAAHVEGPGICLCEAVARNELDFVARLLANGMNPNSKNYNLQTPLHVAAAEGLFEVSVLLLQNGGSVIARDRWGRTPLEEARVGGDHKLVQLLEDAKRRHQMSDFSG